MLINSDIGRSWEKNLSLNHLGVVFEETIIINEQVSLFSKNVTEIIVVLVQILRIIVG